MYHLLLPFVTALFTGVLVPMPEEAVLIGFSVAAGSLEAAVPVAIVAYLGLYIRDLSLFLLGRALGTAVFRWKLVRRLAGEAPLEGMQERAAEHAIRTVIAARMAFGVRAAAQLTLGVVGVPLRTHLWVNAVVLALWVPFLIGLGLWFHDPAMSALAWAGENKVLLVAFIVLIAAAWITKFYVRSGEAENDDSPSISGP